VTSGDIGCHRTCTSWLEESQPSPNDAKLVQPDEAGARRELLASLFVGSELQKLD
jgi:hypothetical protein